MGLCFDTRQQLPQIRSEPTKRKQQLPEQRQRGAEIDNFAVYSLAASDKPSEMHSSRRRKAYTSKLAFAKGSGSGRLVFGTMLTSGLDYSITLYYSVLPG